MGHPAPTKPHAASVAMSGYDPATGWVSFSPSKVSRYFRAVPGRSGDIERRLEESGWSGTGASQVSCTPTATTRSSGRS